VNRERHDLPAGWAWTTLGDICTKPQYGWTTKANLKGKGLKLLRTTDISSSHIDWDSVPFCTNEPDDPEKYRLRKGDILVARAGSVGVSIEIDDCPSAIFASYLIRFCAISPIPSRFVSLYLQSPNYWNAIAEHTAGITIPNVNATKLQALETPLPPLPEQHRIVKKVEILFERLNKTRQQLAKILPLIKKFRQSVLAKAFSGELTKEWRERQKHLEPASTLLAHIYEERKKKLGKKYKEPEPIDTSDLPELPEGWEWIALESAGEIITGNTPATSQKENYGQCIPFIKPGDLDKGQGISTAEIYLSKEGASKARILPPKSIMVTSIGATIGKTGISSVKCATNQQINSIVPFQGIQSYYVYYYCLTKLFFDLTISHSSSTTLPILNKGRFLMLPIPIAHRKEQTQIVKRIKELFARANAIEKAVTIAQARCKKITQSILAKAFKGELVAQDPNDEPAEELLQKIRQRKAFVIKQKSRKGF